MGGWEQQVGGGPTMGSSEDPFTKQQLDKWLAAKRQGDFATADAIRFELRAMGVDPDTVRPPNYKGGTGGGKGTGSGTVGNMSTMGNLGNMGSMGNVGGATETNSMQNQMQMMQMMMQ